MKYIIKDIVWDLDYYVDDSELDLPSEAIVEVHMDSDATELDLEEALSEALSEKFGFCVWQFNYEEVKNKID